MSFLSSTNKFNIVISYDGGFANKTLKLDINDNDGTLEDIGVDLYSYLSIVEILSGFNTFTCLQEDSRPYSELHVISTDE